MKLLVVGSGGREHAIAWRLSRDPDVEEVWTAPGNPGTETIGRRAEVSAGDADALAALVRRAAIDLTVVGPEAPLVAGITDHFADLGLPIFGPVAAAARLEGSKIFAKQFMLAHDIPTAPGRVFDDADAAAAHARERGGNAVVKADGLAAGKGVYVCATVDEMLAAIDRVMREAAHGAAGRRIVIEDLLEGEEASVFCVTDGERHVLLPTSQDHKRLLEGDTGPMTGGMGAVTPAPIMTPELIEQVESTIIQPTLAGMREQGTPYRGFLYLGLMITDGVPQVLEYNCRLGDPEAQAVLPLLDGPLAATLADAAAGRLGAADLRVGNGAAACVVVAAEGYPAAPRKGVAITGLPAVDDASSPAAQGADLVVFHAGTDRRDDRLVSAGGRVLGVTARADSLQVALDRAYEAIGSLQFEGMQYRRDIGHRALARLRNAAREVEQV